MELISKEKKELLQGCCINVNNTIEEIGLDTILSCSILDLENMLLG